MKSFFLMILFLVITQSKVVACPNEIARAPQKHKASPYEVRLLKAIYKHENSQHNGYCMAVLSPKYKGCEAQVKRCLGIIRAEWIKWERRGRKGSYINHLSSCYCPARWDKMGNANWRRGIKRMLKQEYK